MRMKLWVSQWVKLSRYYPFTTTKLTLNLLFKLKQKLSSIWGNSSSNHGEGLKTNWNICTTFRNTPELVVVEDFYL